jgi:hypothetical protein
MSERNRGHKRPNFSELDPYPLPARKRHIAGLIFDLRASGAGRPPRAPCGPWALAGPSGGNGNGTGQGMAVVRRSGHRATGSETEWLATR